MIRRSVSPNRPARRIAIAKSADAVSSAATTSRRMRRRVIAPFQL
jgi:hypothetical protein